jgi:hypothetical protein
MIVVARLEAENRSLESLVSSEGGRRGFHALLQNGHSDNQKVEFELEPEH